MLTIDQIFKDWRPKFLAARNEWRVDCVFRENHKPDSGLHGLVLSVEINAYHCFSCKSHGTLVNLLTTRMKVPFMDAFEIVGTENLLHALKDDRQVVHTFELQDLLPDADPDAFLERGFSTRLMRLFKVGQRLNTHNQQELHIPWCDADGQIVAVKHRIKRSFWYEPEKFPKERYLYNLHRARQYSWVTLVEGETDVYRSCMNGVWNVVAIGGGQLSTQQALLLILYFEEVRTAFDHDSAGMWNTEIAFHLLGPHLSLRVCPYDGDDPGECLDAEAWKNAVEKEHSDYGEYALRMSMLMGDEYNKLAKKAKDAFQFNSKQQRSR